MKAMSLGNGSALSSVVVRRIVEEVAAQVHPEAVERSHILVMSGGEGRMAGWAYKAKDVALPLPEGRDYLVAIFAGEDESYPYTSLYRDRAGELVFRDWEDEFRAILAHELCHVMQWLEVGGFGKHPHYEVEAERFARAVLRRREE